MPVTSDAELREILGLERVAVVGCSRQARKDAHRIPKYLHEHGYDVIPVNPHADEIFGQEAYGSIADVYGAVEIVDVFRPSDEVADIVEAAIERGDVTVIWTQLGIRDEAAAETAEAAGLRVVQDRCMMVEHRRLLA